MGVLGTLQDAGEIVGAPSTAAADFIVGHVLGIDQQNKSPLMTVIRKAGWIGKDANLAGWVAYAESHGDAKVVNSIGAVGLFQLLVTAHLGQHGSPKTRDAWIKYMQDPQNNANFAHWLWVDAGRDFHRDWQASEGTWGPHRDGSSPPPNVTVTATDQNDSIVTNAEDVAKAAASPLEILGKVAGALLNPSTYLRLGKGFLGGGLIVLGVGGLVYVAASKVASTPVGSAAVKAVKVVK